MCGKVHHITRGLFNQVPGWGKFALACIVSPLFLTQVLAGSTAVEVVGHSDDLHLHVQGASIREVLDALSAKFKLTYRLPSNVSGVINGRYSGSLTKVLARLLDGNDYVVNASGNTVDILVLGPSRATVGALISETPNRAAAQPAGHTPSRPPPLTSYLPNNGAILAPSAGVSR
jgi:hypothetical protein